jgi:hypothetical protein
VQRRVASASSAALDTIEIIVADDVRVRLSGDAQRQVLERILDWLPRR